MQRLSTHGKLIPRSRVMVIASRKFRGKEATGIAFSISSREAVVNVWVLELPQQWLSAAHWPDSPLVSCSLGLEGSRTSITLDGRTWRLFALHTGWETRHVSNHAFNTPVA